MAAMHLCEMDIPKKCVLLLESISPSLAVSLTSSPMVFENLFQWLKTARDNVKFPESETRKQELYNQFNFVALHEELCRLKDRLLRLLIECWLPFHSHF